MKKDPELLVVGGGPAGTITARAASENGVATELIDKKRDPSNSSTCGGLVSIDTWKRLGEPKTALLGKINGAIIHTPDGSEYKLVAESPKAVVLDRNHLNKHLLNSAKKAGAKVETGMNLTEIDNGTAIVSNLLTGHTISYSPNFIVGADGPMSDVRRLSGGESSSKLLYGIQSNVKGKKIQRNLVEVFFGSEVAPGFFAWVIPTEHNRARVGLATTHGGNLPRLLTNLLNKLDVVESSVPNAGVIPVGTEDASPEKNILYVGDAAGQVKPTTGGGLYPISIAGEIAGRIVKNGLSGLDSPNTAYREAWMEEFGRDLNKEMVLHKILIRLSDDDFNSAFKLLDNRKVAKLLINRGNTDHIYPIVKDLVRSPSILAKLVTALPTGLGTKLKQELYR